ncbi:MAG: uncharacterized protein KVP18_003401 [Porospora cf. gigantea A]|uniref:uncharacterized protein n=1 Tax=Porospora cf. gigantea A TaxID=2853593 RepID=UPI003559E608|nr:MAG: hypothetical protein KVP18_003401 [Porospora cf. gigantea A]
MVQLLFNFLVAIAFSVAVSLTGDDRDRMLASINDERDWYGVAPLRWDSDIEANAVATANLCLTKHSATDSRRFTHNYDYETHNYDDFHNNYYETHNYDDHNYDDYHNNYYETHNYDDHNYVETHDYDENHNNYNCHNRRTIYDHKDEFIDQHDELRACPPLC